MDVADYSRRRCIYKTKRYIIETVVSEYDVKHLLTLIYQTDPDAFTTISNVDMVRGRFYLPPLCLDY